MTGFSNSIAPADVYIFKMYEYDDLSFSLGYKINGGDENLLDYRFDFLNKFNTSLLKTYTIISGEQSNVYITKSGNLLLIGGMLNDIRTRLGTKTSRLICRAVHPDGQKFTHFVWDIEMQQY
ncbi:MAG: hypothetical protein H0X33_14215 [Taibaiella sp.]|nr:hypothetical protein [Taibaiella sp.]